MADIKIRADRYRDIATTDAAWDKAALDFFSRGNTVTIIGQTIDESAMRQILAAPAGERQARLREAFPEHAELSWISLSNFVDDLIRERPQAQGQDFAVYEQVSNNGLNAHGFLRDHSEEVYGAMAGASISVAENASLVLQPPTPQREAAIARRTLPSQDLSFWDKLLDLLIEVGTLSLADTRTFNGKPDTDAWKQNGASLAVAGGVELRGRIMAANRDQGIGLLAGLVHKVHPEMSSEHARAAAAIMYPEMRSIYARVPMPVLGTIHKAVLAASPSAFAPNAGAWLQQHLGELAAPQAFVQGIADCKEPAEVMALLALSPISDFAALPPEQQVELSRRLWNDRVDVATGQAPRRGSLLEAAHDASLATIYDLLTSPAFASLPNQVRFALFARVIHVGTHGAENGALGDLIAAPAFAALPDADREAALLAIAQQPPGREYHGLPGALRDMVNGETFSALPADLRTKLVAALVTVPPEARGLVGHLLAEPYFVDMSPEARQSLVGGLTDATRRTAILAEMKRLSELPHDASERRSADALRHLLGR